MRPSTPIAGRAPAVPGRETPVSRRYLRVLQRWIPVGLAYYQDWPDRPNCGHFFGGCSWYGEETASCVLAFAAAASSPEFDAGVCGCSREDLRAMALKGIRYLGFTHDTGPPDCVRPGKGLGHPENFGTKWGERGKGFFRESQCGCYIAMLSTAALLLGDVVDDETWGMLAAIHEDYAGRFAGMPPRSGVYVNTQMEENAWTSAGLASVESVLGDHPSAPAWAGAARRWMFCTVLTPQDAKNHAVRPDGRSVRQHVGETFTALPDYWTENHGMVHPTYTATCLEFLNTIGVVYGLRGRPVPAEALVSRQVIYDRLKRVADQGGYLHPPQGMDWPYLPPDPAPQVHSAAAVILKDPDGARIERRALETLERRQAGYGGRLYDPRAAEVCHTIQDPLIILETVIARPTFSYLLHRLLGDGPAPTGEKELERKLRGTTVYPHSGFAFHRHRRGQTSFAWRNCIMALPLNSDGLCTVAPASNSFLGTILVKGRPDSHEQVSLHVDRHQDGFAACLVMDRAQGSIRQEVLFASLPTGASLSFERFTAREALTVERVEQGFLRIINEDFKGMEGNCDGSRMFHAPEGSEVFKGFVSADPDSDVVRTYDHPAWVNVDDRLGLVFRGTGRTIYHNRHYFKPWWAVADDLTLSRIDKPFRVKAGETVGELIALVAPDQAHGRTAKQALTVLSARKRAVGLIADGHLAAASFETGSAAVAFTCTRKDLTDIPVFEGVTDIGKVRVTYTRTLQAGQACLQKALASVRTDDAVEITAAGGNLLARNPGAKPVSLTLNAARSVRIAPGRIVQV